MNLGGFMGFKELTEEEIFNIHRRGYITPREKVDEWERLGLCAPSNSLGHGSEECKEFSNCHECLVNFANQKDEWISLYRFTTGLCEQPMFNIGNVVKPKVLTKKKD